MDNEEAQLFEDLTNFIEGHYKSSRQRSLALTKLEEAYLWLIRAEPKEWEREAL